MSFLFVYGTLMRAYGNEKVHRPLFLYAEYLGKARCAGKLFEIDGYPGLVVSKESTVYGELYQIHDSERLFDILDEYEGYDANKPTSSEYIRKELLIEMIEGDRKEMAWVYVYNWAVDETKSVLSGDYTKKGSD